MPPHQQLEPRVAALEIRVEEVAVDATAALHVASELSIKVDANRESIDALRVQTAARFDQVDQRLARIDQRFDLLETKVDANRRVINALGEQTAAGFAEVRARLDQTAAGFETIGNLLTTLVERDEK